MELAVIWSYLSGIHVKSTERPDLKSLDPELEARTLAQSAKPSSQSLNSASSFWNREACHQIHQIWHRKSNNLDTIFLKKLKGTVPVSNISRESEKKNSIASIAHKANFHDNFNKLSKAWGSNQVVSRTQSFPRDFWPSLLKAKLER